MVSTPVLAFFVAPILLGAGCSSLPVSFPPPAQRPALEDRHFVMMGDPDAGSFIVQGFRAKSEGEWRWALDHPVLRFILPDAGLLQFAMDFTLPDATFQATGPVTLAISINGHLLDRPRYDHAGNYHYARAVPDALLHQPGENLVAIDPDKVAMPGKLGFVLTRAGFAE